MSAITAAPPEDVVLLGMIEPAEQVAPKAASPEQQSLFGAEVGKAAANGLATETAQKSSGVRRSRSKKVVLQHGVDYGKGLSELTTTLGSKVPFESLSHEKQLGVLAHAAKVRIMNEFARSGRQEAAEIGFASWYAKNEHILNRRLEEWHERYGWIQG